MTTQFTLVIPPDGPHLDRVALLRLDCVNPPPSVLIGLQ